ncbi:hypothetical protein [Pseudomonas sp. Q1]|uniref:hypothetical protein n=1 Tax=Pseudomonas sp. Q1 TaxID=2202823 RepID=UPI001375375C|nr:hypothetical protein [Pseudomonas sp. Q1]
MAMALGNCVVVVEQRTSSAALSAFFISDHDRCDPSVSSAAGEVSAVLTQAGDGLAVFFCAGEVEHCVALQGSVVIPSSPRKKAAQ